MIELRWKNILSKVQHNGVRPVVKTVLQYRQLQSATGTLEASSAQTEWSEWQDVPAIDVIPN